MNVIFMNLENSKTSKTHVLTLKLASKLDLRIGEKAIALSHLLDMEKHKKAQTIIINLKYLHPHGMMNFSYQMDLILYQILKNILNTF